MLDKQLERIGRRVEADGLAGCAASFESFYDAEHRRVLAICHALAGGRPAAEDISQEAFIRAYTQWNRVSVMDRPDAWVRRVAINLATSRRRRIAAEARALMRMGASGSVIEDAPTFDGDFWAVVRRLPTRQAQAVALRYADDLAVSDVAAAMGCAEGTVKAHLHAARAAIASRLGLENGTDV